MTLLPGLRAANNAMQQNIDVTHANKTCASERKNNWRPRKRSYNVSFHEANYFKNAEEMFIENGRQFNFYDATSNNAN